jgi:conjugal transfer/entry exclusion protein
MMALDLVTELVAALRSADGRAAIADAVGPAVDAILQRRLAEQAEQLQPLATILGIDRKAATQRIARDAALRALGVPSGKRLVFKATDVQTYLKTRAAR